MPKPYASAQKIALAAVLNVEPPVYELPSPSKPLPNSLPSECGDSLPLLPRTSVSVMAVMNDHGYLTPLCTVGDLLRCCKAAWRAELD
jgi:hypothetical protein